MSERSAGIDVEESGAHREPPRMHLSGEPHRRGRAGIVVVLIVALLASAVTRQWADQKRLLAIPPRGETGANTSLSSMNSFALGLLLGGLRGPLVMILWTNSENQKSAKNLEGLDTQIEWIRLLQPEFDTVHIFQIWNKAYNISVQMASLANKYSVILDALEYAKSVDREKPDDINILSAIGQLYFDKLGNSNEKLYYRKRVRQESLPHPTLNRQNGGSRRTQMDPVLDENFNILPALTKPLPGHDAPTSAAQEYDDGSDLQYLPRFAPYPDGVSPFAFAYNYDKRAEVLMNVGKQQHAQLSDMVMDSRPALALKNWAEEEWEQGRRRELEAFDLPIPDERLNQESLTMDFAPDHPITNRHAADLAVLEYTRVGKLVQEAFSEYLRHLSTDTTNEANYRSHMEELAGDAQLAAADADYLKAQLAASSERSPLLLSARDHYAKSIYLFEIVMLKYNTDAQYVDPALPPGFARRRMADRKGIEDMTPDQVNAVMVAAEQNRLKARIRDTHLEDQAPYILYMQRAGNRLRQLHAAGI